jgi:hypothetical protein
MVIRQRNIIGFILRNQIIISVYHSDKTVETEKYNQEYTDFKNHFITKIKTASKNNIKYIYQVHN